MARAYVQCAFVELVGEHEGPRNNPLRVLSNRHAIERARRRWRYLSSFRTPSPFPLCTRGRAGDGDAGPLSPSLSSFVHLLPRGPNHPPDLASLHPRRVIHRSEVVRLLFATLTPHRHSTTSQPLSFRFRLRAPRALRAARLLLASLLLPSLPYSAFHSCSVSLEKLRRVGAGGGRDSNSASACSFALTFDVEFILFLFFASRSASLVLLHVPFRFCTMFCFPSLACAFLYHRQASSIQSIICSVAYHHPSTIISNHPLRFVHRYTFPFLSFVTLFSALLCDENESVLAFVFLWCDVRCSKLDWIASSE